MGVRFCLWLAVCLLAVPDLALGQSLLTTRGPIRRRTIAVEPFRTLVVAAAFNIYYTPSQGATEVVVEGPEEILGQLELSNVNNQLVIAVRYNDRPAVRFNLFLTAPPVADLTLIGEGDFIVTAPLTVRRLDLRCQGAISLQAELDVDTLAATWSGAGRWLLAGRATHQLLRLGGATDLNSSQLKGQSADLSAVGAGTIALGQLEAVRTRAAGPVSITYRGNPKVERLPALPDLLP